LNLDKIINADVTLVAIPFFFLAILIEIIVVKFFNANGSIDTKDNSVSIFMGLMSVVVNGLAAFITLNVLFWFELPLLKW